MTIKKRIISRFDIKGPNLVKGINLEGLRIIGLPDFYSEIYYNDNIDEIFFQDTVASLYGRNSLEQIISSVSTKIFVPLVVSGGIRTTKDIRQILKAGADKISINSEAIKNKKFIQESVEEFGSSTISGNIQVQKKLDGKYYCFYENGRQETNLDPLKWALELQKYGVGEIVLTFINFDGTGKGFDYNLIKTLRKEIHIPLVVSGGIGSMLHVKKAFDLDVDGVSISSSFHYYYLQKYIDQIKKQKFAEGNLNFISNLELINNDENFSIFNLKKYLKENNVNCR